MQNSCYEMKNNVENRLNTLNKMCEYLFAKQVIREKI